MAGLATLPHRRKLMALQGEWRPHDGVDDGLHVLAGLAGWKREHEHVAGLRVECRVAGQVEASLW